MSPDFSPRAFYRARRPDRFSDTLREAEHRLDRSMVEYHLDTLTNRNQEADFERFARLLAARTVCPNLLPHTGPTGGGDSRVDSETYPVAEELSLAWYIGSPGAASERWAFAFSAKKVWRTKVTSDIAKIAATNRDYTKAHFITNQFVSDKKRAALEDELRVRHGIDVRIYDRTWILDRIFEGRHEQLAIDELAISHSVQTTLRPGPQDTVRQQELEAIEKRIREATQAGALTFALVADSIDAATTARGLELPRETLDGLFQRAERLAERFGTVHQRLVAAYQWAWTAYFWYEDYPLLSRLYEEVYEHAHGSENAYDLELLTNLWHNLHTAVQMGAISAEEADYRGRTVRLTEELKRLAQLPDRPSTVLQAKTLRLCIQLNLDLPDNIDSVLSELGEVIRQCEGLVGYPLRPLVEVLVGFGKIGGDRPAYNQLVELIEQVMAAREGEVAAARILVRRGDQELENDRPYQAIQLLGRALTRLFKHESRREMIAALAICGSAYERVGLLWAARGSLLTAASIAGQDFWSDNRISPGLIACTKHLKWLELRLGRLPQVLAWHEVDRVFRAALAARGHNRDELFADDINFDGVITLLMLRADLSELQGLTKLPDILDQLDLPGSSIALEYALGHEDEAVPELLVQSRAKSVPEMFAIWRDQPAAHELPVALTLGEDDSVSHRSTVLGCRVTVTSDNQPPCCEVAESILAALESILSTAVLAHAVSMEPVLEVTVRLNDQISGFFDFTVEDRAGRPAVEVRCGTFDPNALAIAAQAALKGRMFELLAYILPRVFLLGSGSELITKLFDDERAAERALDFTGSFVSPGNILGRTPKTRISAWVGAEAREYPLTRSVAWDASDRMAEADRAEVPESTKPQGEKDSADMQFRSARHDQMATLSLIRIPVWDQAKWCGFGMMADRKGIGPPILVLIFEGPTSARQIFEEWRKELGPSDTSERLRVTIVRRISSANPFAYRVVIGSNFGEMSSLPGVTYAFLVSRTLTMEPASDTNLVTFLEAYRKAGRYLLVPAIKHGDDFVPELKGGIEKRAVFVYDAWQLGPDDPDGIGVELDDDPIIPADQENAPVLELLRRRRRERGT